MALLAYLLLAVGCAQFSSESVTDEVALAFDDLAQQFYRRIDDAERANLAVARLEAVEQFVQRSKVELQQRRNAFTALNANYDSTMNDFDEFIQTELVLQATRQKTAIGLFKALRDTMTAAEWAQTASARDETMAVALSHVHGLE